MPFVTQITDLYIISSMGVIARLSFVFFLLPGIGDAVIPMRVRLMILLIVSWLVFQSGVAVVPLTNNLIGHVGFIGKEAMIGLSLGIGFRSAIWVLSITGSIIAQTISLSQFMGVAIENEAQTIISNILSLTGTAVLLASNFHYHVIALMVETYLILPVDANLLTILSGSMDALLSVIKFAFFLAMPFVAVNFLYNICLGFVNKALPQLMVAFIGAPFIIAAGIIMLFIALSTIITIWQNSYVSSLLG